MKTTIFCVLVNWNLKSDTIACIESLLNAGVPTRQIIVVDNGSVDGSLDAIAGRFSPKVNLIANKENLGYASGLNQGINQALSLGAEWVFVLNNDTLCSPDIFDTLGDALEKDDGISILAPLILYFDRPNQIWYTGDRLLPGSLITTSLYKNTRDSIDLPELLPVDFVSGCGMLINKDVFDKIGVFDTSLFMYGEEVDFCWRARQGGMRLVCATRAKMWHKVSASANKEQVQMRYFRIRNQNVFYRRYARGIQIPAMLLFTLLRNFRICISDLLQNQVALIPPLLRGWYDGWFGKKITPVESSGYHQS